MKPIVSVSQPTQKADAPDVIEPWYDTFGPEFGDNMRQWLRMRTKVDTLNDDKHDDTKDTKREGHDAKDIKRQSQHRTIPIDLSIMGPKPLTKDAPFEQRPTHPHIVRYWEGVTSARAMHVPRRRATELAALSPFSVGHPSTDDGDDTKLVAKSGVGLFLPANWQVFEPNVIDQAWCDQRTTDQAMVTTLVRDILRRQRDVQARLVLIQRVLSLESPNCMPPELVHLIHAYEIDSMPDTFLADAKCSDTPTVQLKNDVWFEYELQWARACGYSRLFLVFHHKDTRWRAPINRKDTKQYFGKNNPHVRFLTLLSVGVPHVIGDAILVHCDRHTNQILPLDMTDYRVMVRFLIHMMSTVVSHVPWPRHWSMECSESRVVLGREGLFRHHPHLATRPEFQLDVIKTLWLESKLSLEHQRRLPLLQQRAWFERHACTSRTAIMLPMLAEHMPIPESMAVDERIEQMLHAYTGQWVPSLNKRRENSVWRVVPYTDRSSLILESYTAGTGSCFAPCKITTVTIGQFVICLKSLFPTLRHSNVADSTPTLGSTARPHCLEDEMLHFQHHHQSKRVPIPNILATHLAQEPLFGPVLVYGEDPVSLYSVTTELLLCLVLAQEHRFSRSRYSCFHPGPRSRISNVLAQTDTIRALNSVVDQQLFVANLIW